MIANTKKILFPVDFSTVSEASLPLAESLARGLGATLVILHVEEPPLVYAAGEYYYGVSEPDSGALMNMLHGVKPLDPTIRFEHRMVMGEPAEEIVRMAEDEHVDMIVIGTHGRTGLTRLLMGSVAEQVVRKAHCPVVVAKQPATVATKKTKQPAASVAAHS